MPVSVYLSRFDPSHEQSDILNGVVEEGAHVCEVEMDRVIMSNEFMKG